MTISSESANPGRRKQWPQRGTPEWETWLAKRKKRKNCRAPRMFEPWTAEEDDRLRTGFTAGLSLRELGDVHQRTIRSLRRRMRDIGVRWSPCMPLNPLYRDREEWEAIWGAIAACDVHVDDGDLDDEDEDSI